jgi:hypothetical protein
MGEGLSTIDRTILSTKSVVYRACQTKQRTSSKGRTHGRFSVERRSCEAGNPPRKNLVSEPRGSRDRLSAKSAQCEEPPPNIRPAKAGNLCPVTCTRKSCQNGMYSARHPKKHARGAHPSLLSTNALFWCRLCAVVCVVGRRLQSDYSDADSLGLFKALGYCAECASHVVHRHMCMRSDRPASGGNSGWIRGM